jgi:outer membrane protein, multidrug efflux system
MSARRATIAWTIAAALLATACATPEPTRPVTTVPDGWRGPATTTDNLADRPWGKVFEGRELDALIAEALANNSDLRIAADRVELARAQFGFQRSFLYPAVGLSATGTRQRTPVPGSTDNAVSESASLGLAVPTWEIDLWGRVRSATEAARRELLATEGTRRALHASIVAQVASGYLELLSLDAQLEASRRTAAARRESLRLIELRYRGGVASRLELNDQISLVAGADRATASLERQRSLAENALSTLVGRNPGPIMRQRQLADLTLPVELPAGLPSALLTRRYDVLAAEERLYGADANIDAARKAYFPTITLTGIVGFASPALRDLFDSGRYAWSASPGIGLPIFNAGRLTSNLEAAQAQQRIAVEQYKLTIRVAFREVEDALASYQRLTEERTALTQATNANRERLRLSELRYRAGVAAYFEVLDSSRQLFDSELALIQVTAGQYQSVIQLYQALGGGYDASTAAAPSLPATPYSAPRSGTVWWF